MEWHDRQKLKWFLRVFGLFVVSCFLCYDEVAFLVSGRETQATLTKTYETSDGRLGRSSRAVDFTFTEADGTFRRGTDTVDADWPVPKNGKVAVQYTPGELGRARLAGHVYWWAVIFFTACVLVMGVFVFLLWREAVAATRPAKPRARRVRGTPAQ